MPLGITNPLYTAPKPSSGFGFNPINVAKETWRKVTDPNYDLIPGITMGGGNSGQRSYAPVNRGTAISRPIPEYRSDNKPGDYDGDGTTDYSNYSDVLGSSTGGGGQDISADLAYYADQEGLLRDLLGRIGTQRQNGLTQINDDFGREQGRAQGRQAQAEQDLNTKLTDTQMAKQTALNRNDTNTRVLANSVRGIVGRASGSGSSAYQLAAPNAIQRQANNERSDVQQTFGQNFRDIDTTKKRQKSAFEELLEDLGRQRSEKTRGLEEGLLGQEQEIYGSMADINRNRTALQGGDYGAIRAAGAPDMARYSERGSRIDELFNKYRTPYNVRNVDTTAPNLRDYVTGQTGVQQQQTAQQTQDFFTPKREEDEERLY